MSLITDALKTAQRQRTDSLPAKPGIPTLGGFFPDSGRRREPSARWRGAAAGGAIGVLLLIGAGGVREWRAMHPARLPVGIGAALPRPAATLAAPKSNSVVPTHPVTHSDSIPAAAQQGEQVGRAAVPPAIAAAAPAHETRSARRSADVAPGPAPAPSQSSAPAATTTHPTTQAAPPAPVVPSSSSNGVQVSVQGGVQDASDRLLEQARDAQRQGDVAAAEDVYRRALTTHEASPEIYNNYAALLADRGDTTRAITMYKLAITLDRTYADAWSNLGTLLDAAGDHRQATGVFQQVLKLDSTNVAAREGLAEQYQALGDYSAARKLFERITREAPDYARAHYEMALLLDGMKDSTGATREYTLFLQTSHGRYPQVYSDRVRARISALSPRKP